METPGATPLTEPMNSTSTLSPVLVLGATGTTGRRVTGRLEQRGVSFRAASRRADPPFEWSDPSTWPAVLDGAAAVYLCYSPDLAVPGAAETVGRLAENAVAGGASRLVLLSGRGEPGAAAGEAAVRSAAETAGVDWTVVRSARFAQNFSESFLLEQVEAGTVTLPVDQVREPFVDVEDVADVVVAALLDAGHAGRVYEVTGPRLLTFAEAVAEVAAATGRGLAYRSTTLAEQDAALAAAGVGDDVAWLMHHLFAEVLDGRSAHLADGVQQAIGRPPGDFRGYARRAAAAGAWAGALAGSR